MELTVEKWLGENNQLGIDIWHKKYQHNNESFTEWLNRISGGDKEVAQIIYDKKFLFGGRILATRGIDDNTKASYSNCYVMESPEDSIESIYDTCKNLARTYSYGGGCGIDISNLAPEGAKVNNQAKTTSGAVSFMDTFSQVTQQICQHGRRGALMISLDCTHPDLEKFITIKNDLTKVNFANISVRVSDAFMLAVQNDNDWELYFNRPETNERISKIVKARQIYRLLCESNWNYAEPGMLFWDTINSNNLQSENSEFSYAGVNPCVSGETLISTTKGEIQIKDLVGQTPDVYCMNENGELTIQKASKVWLTRKQAQIITIHTHKGELKCTPDHLIHTRNRGWIQAQDLKHGDKITGLNRQMKDEKHLSVGLSGSKYYTEHRLVAGYYYDITNKDIHHKNGDTFDNSIDNLEVLSHNEHSALTNTNRHINPLRNELGQFVSKPIKKKRQSINQNINRGTNWFVDWISWENETEDVYDMTVPVYHNFIANRMVVHNCAEEPLPANGACLLGSINLSSFVKNGQFDFDDYIKTIRIAVKALDAVQTEGSTKHPLKAQQQSAKDWRQIGLGVMGIADMLIKLELTYGSKESLCFCNKIANLLTVTALDTSADLAKELGKYPKYNDSVLKSAFLNQHCDLYTEEGLALYLKIKDNGLRNSQLLTIAPTGTLSTMLGISGGIEPIFANSYTRTTKTLHDKDVVYKVYTPIVEEYMKAHNLQTEEELPEWFVTSATIPIEQRINMQSIWQFHIDASISSTINLPHEATIEDVEKLYMLAWEKGLKGITVYRSGCAREGILNTAPQENTTKSTMNIGMERHLTTGCGTLHVVAFFDENGKLKNTYLSKGSSGGCNNFMISLSRMISLAARNDISLDKIIDQLNSCGTCPSYATRRATKHDTSPGSCCPVAVANALKDMYKEITGTEFNISINSDKTNLISTEQEINICPECGGQLKHEMGCVTCTSCGYSKCG